MSDARYWFDEFSREVEQLRIVLDKLRTLVDSSNLSAVESSVKEIEAKFIRAKEIKKSFGLEMRLVRDRKERSVFESESKILEQRLEDCVKELARLKTKNDRKDLMGGKADAPASGAFAYSTEGKNNDQLLGEANKIQDMTFESLNRTKNMIEASKEVGTATLETLRGQREQITEISNEVDKLDDKLGHASKLVMNFGRRMATDRLIQMFAALNIVIMLALILYVVVSGKSLAPSTSSSGGSSSAAVSSSTPIISPTVSPAVLALDQYHRRLRRRHMH